MIDCRGLHILPGVIDTQVHFREPGLTHKEDLETGSHSAVMGGVTAVFEMPNTNPLTVTEETFTAKVKAGHHRMHCDFAFFIGGTRENVQDLPELERAPGCAGVKVFIGSSTGALLVEDDELLGSGLNDALTRAQYAHEWVRDGRAALAAVRSSDFDLVILDLGLPRLDGMGVLQQMRAGGDRTPVLILSARDAIRDRILGLNAGADDYLVKPFEYKELVARVRALTRRHAPQRRNVFEASDLKVDLDTGEVSRGGVPIALSRKESMLLVYFLRHPGQLVTHEQIIESAWDAESEASADVVRAHLKNLRKKIEAAGGTPLIRTVHGLGYRLEP